MKPCIYSMGHSPLQAGAKWWKCSGDGDTGVYTTAIGYSPSAAYFAWLRQQIEVVASLTWNKPQHSIPWWDVLCGVR